MESELEKFRRKKRLEAYKSDAKGRLEKLWSKFTNSISRAVLPNTNVAEIPEADNSDPTEEPTQEELKNTLKKSKLRNRKKLAEAASSTMEENTEPPNKYLKYIQQFLKLLTWVLLYIGFLKLGFGAVYFVISCLWFIWRNLRSDAEKKQGEPSAYSVFNPNCESLDGALKAEDLEKQLLYRT